MFPVLFELSRGSRKPEWEFDGLEGEKNAVAVNDLFVPSAAVLAALYFLLAGNVAVLLLIVLAGLLAYKLLSSSRSRQKQAVNPALF